jgi:hypothetical protein
MCAFAGRLRIYQGLEFGPPTLLSIHRTYTPSMTIISFFLCVYSSRR